MKRRVATLALAAVIGLTALSLLGGAAAGDSGGSTDAPKSLTHHFPLGTETLSHSQTAGGSATTHGRTPPTTSPGRSTATPQRAHRSAPAGRHGGAVSPVVFLLAIPVLIAAALLSRVAIRKSRRSARVERRSVRRTRTPDGARWAYVDKDEVERTAPPLPVRRRAN